MVHFLTLSLFVIAAPRVQAATAADPRATEALAIEARSLLDAECLDCHDAAEGRSGLSLAGRDGALKGGKRGPALVPGDARSSLMMKTVLHAVKPTMPPGNDKLSDDQVAILRRWIDAGAPWPQGTSKVPPAPRWWSFQKPQRPSVPKIQNDWVRTPVDAFILAKLNEKGLRPAAEADRLTFIRRATFDLHGLPPTEAQITAFKNDTSPKAYETLVDRLLASPHYGEKWGRHWLDLVRYADTSGFEQDPYLLDAWRYRDWVIAAFNDDKPYDRFIKEQIAGDEIYPDDPQARAGTGYFTVGPNRDMLFKVEDINRTESLTDFVDTTSATFMGLSMGCARCHDHKYDPISQKDYFRMWAVFVPAVKTRVFLHYNDARSFDIGENVRTFKLRDIGEQLGELMGPAREKAVQKKKSKSGPAQTTEITEDDIRAVMGKEDALRLRELEHRLVNMFSGYRPGPMAPGITDVGPQSAEPTFMPLRGGGQGERLKPGLPAALGGGDIPESPKDKTATSTGRRRALAEWLASPNNPLTARVIVNRLWQFHFGRGIVESANDFGRRGLPPSHPELLDWLATELVAQGFSLKKMHRLLMLSSVYRSAPTESPEAHKQDAENRLLSHASRRRLTAEEVRDAILLASGSLNPKMYGRPVVPPLAAEELFGMSVPIRDAWVVTGKTSEHTRRSVYLLSRRGYRQPLLEAFDSPESVLSCPRRDSSTTAPQSLTMLNSGFAMDQARAFAKHLDLGAKDEAVVTKAFRMAFGRDPVGEEIAVTKDFLGRQAKNLNGRSAAFVELGRSLFNMNEFLYVE